MTVVYWQQILSIKKNFFRHTPTARFIYLWLLWVFVAEYRLSLAVVLRLLLVVVSLAGHRL